MMQTAWRKSSRSAPNDNCVEARGISWRKSSHSGGGGGDNCLEARGSADGFEVRDSKLGDDSPAFGLDASDFLGLLKAASRA